MSATAEASVSPSPKGSVLKRTLEFIQAMKTAPQLTPEETAEMIALEEEFITRIRDANERHPQ